MNQQWTPQPISNPSFPGTPDEHGAALVSLHGLTKRFGQHLACSDIDLSVRAGEIHAILGENGAGKSTLMRMLFGALQPDAGRITWQGRTVQIKNPAVARELGLGMVFQQFSLFESLTVAENISLSLRTRERLSTLAAKAIAISHSYGLPLNPEATVGDLSVGQRQRVEIVRCLLQVPKLIILDEPTAVLTPQEADRLFETLDRLRSEGRAILYISHRLDEIRRLCDRATILRQGKVVGTCVPARETAASLAALMVGEGTADAAIRTTRPVFPPKVRLAVRNLTMAPTSPFGSPLADVSLELKAGTILGIAGVSGNGQSELFDTLSGETASPHASTVSLGGVDVGHTSITARRKLGAAFVPEDRLGHGCVPEMTLSENYLVTRHGTDHAEFVGPTGEIDRKALRASSSQLMAKWDVRAGHADPIAGTLSGGNLQKYVVAREVDREPAVMVINQPTWGVDASASKVIHKGILDLAGRGSAVVVISQDLDELFQLADEIAVLHHGRLSAPIPTGVLTREHVGLLMGGASADHSSGGERVDAD